MKNVGLQLRMNEVNSGVLEAEIQPLYDNEGKIVSGWKIGDVQAQNEALILMSQPGEWKEQPTLGVALENALLSDTTDLSLFRREVRRCYKMDGLVIDQLDLYDLGKVNIKAHYE